MRWRGLNRGSWTVKWWLKTGRSDPSPEYEVSAMSSQAVVAVDARQQEQRARALDENFDAERRQIGERVAVMFRWIFLALLGGFIKPTSTTHLPPQATGYLV